MATIFLDLLYITCIKTIIFYQLCKLYLNKILASFDLLYDLGFCCDCSGKDSVPESTLSSASSLSIIGKKFPRNRSKAVW